MCHTQARIVNKKSPLLRNATTHRRTSRLLLAVNPARTTREVSSKAVASEGVNGCVLGTTSGASVRHSTPARNDASVTKSRNIVTAETMLVNAA